MGVYEEIQKYVFTLGSILQPRTLRSKVGVKRPVFSSFLPRSHCKPRPDWCDWQIDSASQPIKTWHSTVQPILDFHPARGVELTCRAYWSLIIDRVDFKSSLIRVCSSSYAQYRHYTKTSLAGRDLKAFVASHSCRPRACEVIWCEIVGAWCTWHEQYPRVLITPVR